MLVLLIFVSFSSIIIIIIFFTQHQTTEVSLMTGTTVTSSYFIFPVQLKPKRDLCLNILSRKITNFLTFSFLLLNISLRDVTSQTLNPHFGSVASPNCVTFSELWHVSGHKEVPFSVQTFIKNGCEKKPVWTMLCSRTRSLPPYLNYLSALSPLACDSLQVLWLPAGPSCNYLD